MISVVIAVLSNSEKRAIFFQYMIIPAVLFVFFLATQIRSRHMENNKVLTAFSGMSYQFFLIQLFLWKLSSMALSLVKTYDNDSKIICSFILCTLVSFVMWKFYDKPIRKVLIKRMLI